MNHFRYLRIAKGLTQRDLAKRLGVHETALSRMENGWIARINPTVERRIKRIFGSQWSFDRLMERVPDLSIQAPDAD